MKILQVINTLEMGGAERLLMDFVPDLHKRGFDVDVLLLKDVILQQIPQNVNIYSLGKGNLYNPLLIFKLRRYMKQYDVIHVHLFPAQYFVALAKWISFTKVRLITTEHSTNNRRRNIWYFKWLDRFIYRRYEKVICISDKTMRMLSEYLGTEKNLITIENGINLSKIIASESYGKKELVGFDDIFLIVQVASFLPAKAQDTVIRAIAKLPKMYHAAFIGDGERRAECEELARKCGVTERVHFMGIRNDVSQILKTADIVVMSSHWEGLSLSSIEGMCCGKPFVASDVPGLHEVVNGAGLLFEHENAEQLAQIIKKISEDKTLYSQIVEKCKQRAMQYSIDRMVDRYEKVYKDLCDDE